MRKHNYMLTRNHVLPAIGQRPTNPGFQRLGFKGLQNQTNHRLLVSMKQNTEKIRKDVAAHRARQAAAGRVALNTYVPGDLVEALDQIKERRGAPGRAPLIEEALRLLIEKETRA